MSTLFKFISTFYSAKKQKNISSNDDSILSSHTQNPQELFVKICTQKILPYDAPLEFSYAALIHKDALIAEHTFQQPYAHTPVPPELASSSSPIDILKYGVLFAKGFIPFTILNCPPIKELSLLLSFSAKAHAVAHVYLVDSQKSYYFGEISSVIKNTWNTACLSLPSEQCLQPTNITIDSISCCNEKGEDLSSIAPGELIFLEVAYSVVKKTMFENIQIVINIYPEDTPKSSPVLSQQVQFNPLSQTDKTIIPIKIQLPPGAYTAVVLTTSQFLQNPPAPLPSLSSTALLAQQNISFSVSEHPSSSSFFDTIDIEISYN